MRIEITKDYKGPIGTFKKGETYNRPANFVKRLPEDCYKERPAPETEVANGTAAKPPKKKSEQLSRRA